MEPSEQPFLKPPLYEASPPKDPHATALTAPAISTESENEDEWEYEYSAAETEVRMFHKYRVDEADNRCRHTI